MNIYGIIYLVRNKINNKCYVGQTKRRFSLRYKYGGKTPIERIYNYHVKRKEYGDYYNKHLLNAIDKYGQSNFYVCEVYDIAFSKTELDIKEETYIQLFDSYNNGYNKTLGGQNDCIFYGENNGFYGKHHTEESRRKMSIARKGITPWNKGKHTDNYKSKKVICVTTGKIFDSAKEGAEFYNIAKTGVTACCRGGRKSAGKLDNIKLVWEWYKEDNTEVS